MVKDQKMAIIFLGSWGEQSNRMPDGNDNPKESVRSVRAFLREDYVPWGDAMFHSGSPFWD
jgi:hypothetical protein